MPRHNTCKLTDKVKNKRIQRKRTKGWKMPENAQYVGRPTKWANPFRLWGDMIFCDASHRRTFLDPWVIFHQDRLYDEEQGRAKVVELYADWLVGTLPAEPFPTRSGHRIVSIPGSAHSSFSTVTRAPRLSVPSMTTSIFNVASECFWMHYRSLRSMRCGRDSERPVWWMARWASSRS